MQYLSLLACLAVPLSAAAQDTTTVVLVATTDVHGRVTNWDYVHDREAPGGLARAATVIDSLRALHAGRLLLIDAGDLLQGSPMATYYATVEPDVPNPVVDALNALRYDILVPGNHEFDFGLEYLGSSLSTAAFSVVAANVYRLPRDVPAFQPTAVIDRAGVRIGVVGFTTPGTMLWNRDRLRNRILIRPIMERAEEHLSRLDQAGVDLRVAVLHSGMRGSSYDPSGVGAENVAEQFSRLPTKPHLVILGHSHQTVDTVISGVRFVQPPHHARGLVVIRVRLSTDSAESRVSAIISEMVRLDSTPPDPAFLARFRQQHEMVRTWLADPLAQATGDWTALLSRAQDTPLIDFINEVQRRETRADLSATPSFDTGAGWGEGPVFLRDIHAIYPYENTLKAVRIDGDALRKYLERSAEYFTKPSDSITPVAEEISGYNYDMVSGVSYVIDLSRPPGSRIRQLTYDGRLVEPSDTFTLALNSYRQSGGGNFGFLADLPVVYDRGEDIRDLLARAVDSVEVLRAADFFQPSWRLIPDDAAQRVRDYFDPPPPPREFIRLRVLALADLQSRLEPMPQLVEESDGRGGLPALKHLMDSLSQDCQCADLRVHAGGLLAGTATADLFFGRPGVEALNVIGFDATAVGDEDLVWGLDTLSARMSESRFKWVSADVEPEDSSIPSWSMIERESLRIAVAGVTVTSPVDSGLARYRVREPLEVLRSTLAEVRAEDPDYVIVLAHAGAECAAVGCEGPLFKLARSLDSNQVDLLVGGETQVRLITEVNGIPVIIPGARGGSIGVVDFVVLPDGMQEVRLQIDTVRTTATVDSNAVNLQDYYRAEVDRMMSRELNRLEAPLNPRAGESTLGRLVADAFRNAARSQIGVVHNAELLSGLPFGNVSYGDVVEVLAPEVRVVMLRVRGEKIFGLLEDAWQEGRTEVDVSGVTVEVDPSKRPGEHIREIRLEDGSEVKRDRVYTLAVSNLLSHGVYGVGLLKSEPISETGVTGRDAVARQLRSLPQPMRPPRLPRFEIRE